MTRLKPHITPVQLEELLNRMPEPYATMVYTAVYTGLRVSEIVGLRWRCIHSNAISIEERYCRGDWGPPKSDASAATIPVNKTVIDRLQRLKSLGPVFTATLTNEVFYKDFHNRREVASYVGLAPSPWRSGGTNREQGISKAGNPRARQKAIELAWLWLKHQPDSALSRWFHERTAQGKGRIKRIAIVALARKLIAALWRFLTTGLVPEGAVLKAVA